MRSSFEPSRNAFGHGVEFDVVQFDTNGAALVIDRCCTVNLPVRDSDFFEGAQRLHALPIRVQGGAVSPQVR